MDYVAVWAKGFVILIGLYFACAATVTLFSEVLRRWSKKRDVQKQKVTLRQYILEIIIASRTVAVLAFCNLLVMYFVSQNMFPSYIGQGLDEPLWRILLDAFIMLAVYDTYFYWTHRLIHHPRLFRAVHLEHHLSRTPTAFTTMRMSIPEAFIQPTFFIVWAYFMPGNPVAFALVVVYTVITAFMGHSGFEWFIIRRTKNPILGLFSTVEHHDLHHMGGYRTNFSIHFTWWDKLMGTDNPQQHNLADQKS